MSQTIRTDYEVLPEFELDSERLVGTFVEETMIPPPPRVPSKLEELGSVIDTKLMWAVDKLTKKLAEVGALEDSLRRGSSEFSQWFPRSSFSNCRQHYTTLSLTENIRQAIRERSIWRFAAVQVTVIQKGALYWPSERRGEPMPNNVQVTLRLGNYCINGMRERSFFVAFAAREHGSLGNSKGWFARIPLQFGVGHGPIPLYNS